MKTFTFTHLSSPIQDFQFLTDSSGFVLTNTGKLYRFMGQQTTLVETPAIFTITHFHFIDQTHGALVGSAQVVKPSLPAQKGSVGSAGLLLLLLLWLVRRGHRRGQFTGPLLGCAGFMLLSGGLMVSCSPVWQRYRISDPSSPYTTLISRPQLRGPSNHTYFANKGLTSFIALTQNQGDSWETHQIPSNFYVTALTAVGHNFFVGTYANERAGAIPLHGDGDIWIYGHDSTLTRKLGTNSAQRPYSLGVSRGIKGFFISGRDSALFAFGSDRMPTLPNTEMSATAGNIYVARTTLQPNFKLIDVPDTVDVHSLSQSGTGELWVTLANQKSHLHKGRLGYVALPYKKLLRFHAGRWMMPQVPDFTSFNQVEFVPGTARGYALTETREVLETSDNGETWQRLPGGDVRQMHAWQNAVTWQRGANELVLYPMKK